MSSLDKPRLLILIAAGISFVFSVVLWFNGQKVAGQSVGLWVPSILAFGALVLSGKEKA